MKPMSLTRKLMLSLFILVALGLIATVLIPSWLERIQFAVSPVGNEVLASVQGNLLNDGSVVKVIKYKSSRGVFVEIHKLGDGGQTSLVERILLPDKQDGLFNFHGQVTRLAIADIDNDGKQELLAPTFDNQLVPHLNVFRYNPSTTRFELISPPQD
jgi:hypothetical protein